MNRRTFLRLLGMGAAGAAVAPYVPAAVAPPASLAFHPDAFAFTFSPDAFKWPDHVVKDCAKRLADEIDRRIIESYFSSSPLTAGARRTGRTITTSGWSANGA